MSQQNVQAARRLYDAFNRDDLGTFEQGISPTIVWNAADSSLNCSGNPYRSFDAIVEGVFKPTARDFDQFRVDLEQLLDAGDYVIGVGRYRGRGRETGRQLSAQYCHLLRFDVNGKVDRYQEFADTLHAAEVVGQAQRLERLQMPQPVL